MPLAPVLPVGRKMTRPRALSIKDRNGGSHECLAEAFRHDLRFQFKPLRLERDGSLVLGLFTDEPKGALVEVEAIPVPEESRSTLLDVVMLAHREDTHKLLRALASGDDLHFALMKPAPPEEEPFLDDPLECLARFVLSNDDEFKDLYEKTAEKVAVCQDATRARQLSENWYRRRTPGRNAG